MKQPRAHWLAAAFFAFALFLPTLPAHAQAVVAPPASAEASGAELAGPELASDAKPEDLQALLETLRDPTKRDALAGQIEALIALQQQAPAQEELGLGGHVLAAFSTSFNRFNAVIERFASDFGDSDRLRAWLERQWIDPFQRGMWINLLRDVTVAVGGGLALSHLVFLALGPVRRRLALRAVGGIFRRVRFAAARLVLDLLPIAVFGAAALIAIGWLKPRAPTDLVLLAIVNATWVSMAGAVLARFLLSPLEPALRLLPLSDNSAVYAYVWVRRLTVLVVWGYLVLQGAILLGLPAAGYAVASKLLGLILLGLLVVLVLQCRNTVAAAILGHPNTHGRRRIVPGMLRARLAEIWHVVIIAYLSGMYVVWAMEIPGGFLYLARATLSSVLVVAAVAAGEVWLPRLYDRVTGIEAGILARYPLVMQRANRYLPVLRAVLVYGFRFVAVLLILAAWQVDIGAILLSESGREIASRVTDIAIVLILSLAAWEVLGGLITAHLNRRDKSGAAIIRSARIRTLLPLIRNALLILISVMATLIVLSEIGIDIAPLLAGAGVVGLAVGFGAQSLVKDVITGAFILFEDTISVGDVVDINGKSGVVEGMTVRTIRLRDLSGSVHTLPFGSIETVTNMTRDFSYYLLDVGVAYRESTDEVSDILREIDAELRADPKYSAEILEPIEILGVDRFEDSAVILRARIKTRPIEQWEVGREFNRRIKMKFDERGIEMPFPHRTLYFGEDKQRKAPPMRMAVQKG